MNVKDIPFRVIQSSGLLHDAYVKLRYPTELQLLKGVHATANSHPSIIHFSVNRAATQYVKRLLGRCGKENGLTPVNINEYASANDIPYLDHLSLEQMQAYKHVFKPQGYVYSAFGGFVRGIEDFDRFQVLLMVRDPRDTLTSLYFSTAFSHSIPVDRTKAAGFVAVRNRAREMTVDDYVLHQAKGYGERYRIYMQELENCPNVHVARYEDMIEDFTGWLDGILSFFSLSVSADTRKRLIDEAQGASSTGEKQTRHRRQVTPGDHLRKLKPETITALNAELADVLGRYGYA